MLMLTDESIMPYGKYKGQEMQDIPAEYLIWCYDNGKCSSGVIEYVDDNMDVLYKEINNK